MFIEEYIKYLEETYTIDNPKFNAELYKHIKIIEDILEAFIEGNISDKKRKVLEKQLQKNTLAIERIIRKE